MNEKTTGIDADKLLLSKSLIESLKKRKTCNNDAENSEILHSVNISNVKLGHC